MACKPLCCSTALLLALACLPASAWTPELLPCPTATVPVLDSAPALDGDLGDAAWESAALLGPFVTMENAGAKNPTEARLLRCGDTLYVGVSCKTPAGAELKLAQTRRDADVYTDESVEVFLDPGVSLRRYFHLLVNAANVQRDESGDKIGTPGYDVDWDGTWKSATARQSDGWSLEMAVSLAEIGLTAGSDALLGLNVCRNDCTAGESVCWSPTLTGFHEPARFGLVSLPARQPSMAVSLEASGQAKLGLGDCEQTLVARLTGAAQADLEGSLIAGGDLARDAAELTAPTLAGNQPQAMPVAWRTQKPGVSAVVVALNQPGGPCVGLWKAAYTIPELLDDAYGYALPGAEKLGLWWTEGLYKVHRDKPMPEDRQDAVRLELAGNEFEAFQLVLRPETDVQAELSVSDFTGPGGTIPASEFTVLQVDCVPVNIPTDRFGWEGLWPDPLPPIDGPVTCRAGENQPLWVLAHAPADTRPGEYLGTVTVSAGDTRAQVPVRLRVFGFSLTPETHIRTAYGVSPDYGYLGVKDPEQQEAVYDLYMRSCRDHRISPYDPMRFSPIKAELKSPMRKLTAGRLSIEVELGQESPWKLYWDGRPIATQQTSMTHFEKEGVGYQGSGVSWPYVEGITSLREVSSTPTMRVWEVVATRCGSGEATRSFRLTFELRIPAGGDWFSMRLTRMESTDPVQIEVREYFNIPRTTF